MDEITVTDVIVIYVEPGETLSEIAARYDVTIDTLLQWNRIDNPDFVLVGQRLVIHTAQDAPGATLSEGAAGHVASRPDAIGVWDGWIGVAVAVGILLLLFCWKRRRLTRFTHASPSFRQHTGALTGKAYVTDGDGISVSGREVRFAGLDAPEWDQVAKHADGYWFAHGRRVKSALIQRIGGKQVHVTVEGLDTFGRVIGMVACNGEDVGEWLVREGHAIAAYSDRYKQAEREARRARRGMWGHAVNIDPRRWRHRKT